MDLFLQWADACSIRLHAGALGSLVGVMVIPAGQDVALAKQFVCSWGVAVFGTPVAVAVAKAVDVSSRVMDNLSDHDAESAGAFLTGMLGWSIVLWINRSAKKIAKGNRKW